MAIQREYLSPNEIAEYLGVSPFTIRRYIKLGELRAVKLLGTFRVHQRDLQRFLQAHQVNPNEEQLEPEEAGDNALPPLPRLGSAQTAPLPAAPPPDNEADAQTPPPARKRGRPRRTPRPS